MQQIAAIAIGFLSLVGMSDFAAGAPKWPLPDGVKTIEVNGYDMAFRDMGSGPALVLVHGTFVDYRYWTPQMQDFAAKHRVIAVSLRHYFPEKWNGIGDDFSIPQHADDLAALIRKLNLGKVHLVGHSRGGAVVLDVAKRHPDVVRTLILADPGGADALLPETPESQRLAQEADVRRSDMRAAVAAGDPEGAARILVDAVNGSGAWAQMSDDRKQRVLDNVSTGTAVDDRPPMSCDDVKKFDFPTLYVGGERSPKRYGAVMAAMRACKDAREPIIIPNAAHSMNIANPAAFNAAVLAFVSEH